MCLGPGTLVRTLRYMTTCAARFLNAALALCGLKQPLLFGAAKPADGLYATCAARRYCVTWIPGGQAALKSMVFRGG